MTKNDIQRPTLEDLVRHMERSFDLAARSEQLMKEADANDAELDLLIEQSEYTLDEVREAMMAEGLHGK